MLTCVVASGVAAEPEPESAAVDDPRSLIERAWFDSGPDLLSRALGAQAVAVSLGSADAEAAARALLSPDRMPIERAEIELAAQLAPNLPLVHVALARLHWAEGERRLAISALGAALRAVPRHLEASAFVASTVSAIVILMLVVASAGLIVSVAFSNALRAAHDLGDLVSTATPGYARFALLASLFFIPWFLGEGPAGLLAVCLGLAVLYGGARHRLALLIAAVFLVLAVEPVARVAGRAFSALGADPLVEAAWAVTRGNARPEDIARLEAASEQEALAAHLLAVDARRRGDLDEALSRYSELVELQPSNPVALTNLANLIFAGGDVDGAIALYERASGLSDSAMINFNLSQAYARAFRMDDFEKALRRAQKLDDRAVAELSRREDPAFTVDLQVPIDVFVSRLATSAQGDRLAHEVRTPLAPGFLGTSWQTLAAGFGIAFVLGLVLAMRVETATSCGRCGRRICQRCDGTVWSRDTCEACHRLFQQPESVDAKLRMHRVAEIGEHEARREKVALAGALLVPGLAGLLARRPDQSLLALLLFGWAVGAIVWRHGVVADPLALGELAVWLFLTTAFVSLALYFGLVFMGVVLRRRMHAG